MSWGINPVLNEIIRVKTTKLFSLDWMCIECSKLACLKICLNICENICVDITQRWTRQSLSVKIDCVLNAQNERWRHIPSIDCCYCTWLEKMIFPTKYTETYTTNTIENNLLRVSMKTVVMIWQFDEQNLITTSETNRKDCEGQHIELLFLYWVETYFVH